MWLSYVLKFAHKVIIDTLLNVPGHWTNKIYSINGYNKIYFKRNVHDRQ